MIKTIDDAKAETFKRLGIKAKPFNELNTVEKVKFNDELALIIASRPQIFNPNQQRWAKRIVSRDRFKDVGYYEEIANDEGSFSRLVDSIQLVNPLEIAKNNAIIYALTVGGLVAAGFVILKKI